MKPIAMILLFGHFAYDGRAQRMVVLLSERYDIRVVSLPDGSCSRSSTQKITYVGVKPRYGFIRRHLSYWKSAILAARKMKPDLVIAEDFFTAFPGYLTSVVCSCSLIYDAHELIIPEPNERLSWRDWVWYRLERFVVKRCDVVIAANPERAAMMQEHYGLLFRPEYMRNIPEQQRVEARIIEEARRCFPALQKNEASERILLYQGFVSLERGLSRFVEAMRYLPKNWRLVVVGDGPDLTLLREAAEPLSAVGRFHALGRIPNDALAPITAACDVGIVSYPFKGLNNIYCAPNKIYEYFLAGLPVIASGQPTIQAILKELPFGLVFDEETTPQELADKIVKVLAMMAPDPATIADAVEKERVYSSSRILSSIASRIKC